MAIAHLPPGEGGNSSLATVHLPSEGISSPQATNSTPANSQASGGLPTLAIVYLPPREGSNSLLGAAHLPWGEGNSSSQVTVLLPSGEGNNSSQAASLLPHSKRSSLPQSSSSTQVGQGSNPTRSLRQGNRCPPGTGQPSLPKRSIPPPGKATPPPLPSVGPPRVLLMNKLTLSGSSTFPTNP